MAKTQQQVLNRALRRIGVLAEDETPSTDTQSAAQEVLDSILAEVRAAAVVSWTANVPDAVFVPLSDLVAADLAPMYPPAVGPSRAMAWMRLMGIIRPTDKVTIFPVVGRMLVAELSSDLFGFERDTANGEFLPFPPGIRQLSASTSASVIRIIPGGLFKLEDLDTLEVRFAGYQADNLTLTWSDTFRDYRVTDAAAAAHVAGRVNTIIGVTILDPDSEDEDRDRALFF